MSKKAIGELEEILGLQPESLLALEPLDDQALQTLTDGARECLEQDRSALESELVDALPRIPAPLSGIARRIFG